MKRVAAALLLLAGSAGAAELLDEVATEAIPAEGKTAQELAARGLDCIRSAAGNDANRVDPALDGDTAYAVVTLPVVAMMTANNYRMRLQVIARDGRYKIAATGIESYFAEMSAWYPVKKITGTGWKKGEAAIKARVDAVAACMAGTQPGAKAAAGDW